MRIPASVTIIKECAFLGCRSLTSVYIPASVWKIDNDAFFNCRNLAAVVIDEGTEWIGDRAFTNCGNLGYVSLPASLTHIGETAFHVYNLSEYKPNMKITFSAPEGSYAERVCKQYGFAME